MSEINITNLTFGYDGSFENVFENVTLRLDTAWRLGLTGRNGRGKTTLLKLLCGEHEYCGSISASVDFEYFPYSVDGTRTSLEIVQQTAPQAEDWEIIRELSYLKTDAEVLYRPFDTLSNGEQTKILLVGMFLRENSFLLIDEPTNHLDAEARSVLADYLKGKSGFILVSHDRAFLDRCINHILVINRLNIELQNGNFSTWQENKERTDNFERSQNARLKREIKGLEEAARIAEEHSAKIEATKFGKKSLEFDKPKNYRVSVAAKAQKLMNRAKNMEQRIDRNIEEKSQLLKNIDMAAELKISPLPYHAKQLVYARNLSLSYGENTVCENVSFSLEQGDRAALVGRNGCGKTSVIKLILGDNIAHSGVITTGSGLVISYVSQKTDGLSGSLGDYAEENGIDESLFKAILRKLDFSRELFERPIESYSQGQKKKVLIARSLSQKAHLYIWDEPLNYIDVMSRIQIEKLITQHKPTLLFVEHDRTFTENVATKEIRL